MEKTTANAIGYRVIEEIERPSARLIERLAEYEVTMLADGARTKIAMEHSIKPIVPGTKIIGPAVTLRLTLGDSLLVSKAIDLAQPGDIIVIDGSGTDANALWGDLRSLSCVQKGIGGAVIDGAIRDIVGCRESGFPIFTKYVVCSSSTKNSSGEINVPIVCGKICVNPGDIIVGDENGVIVIPKDDAEEIMAHASEKAKQVAKMRQDILSGRFVAEAYANKMAELGYK